MTSPTLRGVSSPFPPSIWARDCPPSPPFLQGSWVFSGRLAEVGAKFGLKLRCGGRPRSGGLLVTASSGGGDPVTTTDNDSVDNVAAGAGKGDPFGHLRGVVSSLPPVVFVMEKNPGANFVIGFFITSAIFFIVGRVHAARKAKHDSPGSVADLVRRGQLRSDRRGISTPLKYDDPFNNPLVKLGKTNSTIEMCGKVYRLAPVTLTKEEQAIHKRRRSRAYQWKRPTVFLKEGDTVPPDVDPDTVRWIPANHPFATTASDIDEDLAQTNVYQKHGVPFRIRAEHEALQRKLETLQKEEKLDKLSIDRGNAKDFERPFKFQPKSPDVEQGPPFKSSKSDYSPSSSESNSPPEEIQK